MTDDDREKALRWARRWMTDDTEKDPNCACGKCAAARVLGELLDEHSDSIALELLMAWHDAKDDRSATIGLSRAGFYACYLITEDIESIRCEDDESLATAIRKTLTAANEVKNGMVKS